MIKNGFTCVLIKVIPCRSQSSSIFSSSSKILVQDSHSSSLSESIYHVYRIVSKYKYIFIDSILHSHLILAVIVCILKSTYSCGKSSSLGKIFQNRPTPLYFKNVTVYL